MSQTSETDRPKVEPIDLLRLKKVVILATSTAEAKRSEAELAKNVQDYAENELALAIVSYLTPNGRYKRALEPHLEQLGLHEIQPMKGWREKRERRIARKAERARKKEAEEQ
ncbi:hypothetical protein KBI52_02005 [Microvirga sp. HBU67558]|uniref:hypothetical protein n=1 Tax=Microvirga TaxID=186650 RepID=UPI001B3871E5|nr:MULTISPECIES: hypothetical protein [unclassified Microvirga]MBQ0819035.1 hypothetical protein [Microvirga sp. HBU67558]